MVPDGFEAKASVCAIDFSYRTAPGFGVSAQVGLVRGVLAPQDVGLREERGHLERERGFAARRARDHQVREPGRDPHRGHRATVRRHATVGAERAKVGEERAALRECAGRWRIEPLQRV